MSKTPAEKLLHSLKSTSGARFNASKRLASKDRALTRLTAVTTSYLIVLTILPYFIKVPTDIADTLNFITVLFSIVILVSSLLQYSSGDIVSSEQHHRAALEMKEIYRDLFPQVTSVTPAILSQLTGRYDATLQKYSINHDDVDFMRYQMENPEEYPWLNWYHRLRTHSQTFITRNIYSMILLALTAALFWVVVFYAYPARIAVSEKLPRISMDIHPSLSASKPSSML